MADTPIPRSNPLTRALDRVNEFNAQHGTRAEGGGVPLPPTRGEGMTVSPPTPRALTPEEVEESQRRWLEEDQRLNLEWENSHRAARGLAPLPPPLVIGERVHTMPHQGATTPSIAAPAGFTNFSMIDLVRGQVVADNGQLFPIHPDALISLKRFAFNTAVESIDRSMKMLADKLGLMKEQPKEAVDAADENMPEMSPGEAEGGVQESTGSE